MTGLSLSFVARPRAAEPGTGGLAARSANWPPSRARSGRSENKAPAWPERPFHILSPAHAVARQGSAVRFQTPSQTSRLRTACHPLAACCLPCCMRHPLGFKVGRVPALALDPEADPNEPFPHSLLFASAQMSSSEGACQRVNWGRSCGVVLTGQGVMPSWRSSSSMAVRRLSSIHG